MGCTYARLAVIVRQLHLRLARCNMEHSRDAIHLFTPMFVGFLELQTLRVLMNYQTLYSCSKYVHFVHFVFFATYLHLLTVQSIIHDLASLLPLIIVELVANLVRIFHSKQFAKLFNRAQ